MSATERQTEATLRKLPASARTAAAEKVAKRQEGQARDQFSRTFADVLSGRYGGHWIVTWNRDET